MPSRCYFNTHTQMYKFSEFMALGDKVPVSEVDPLIAKQRPGDCGSLIYTSGTTGNPKVS